MNNPNSAYNSVYYSMMHLLTSFLGFINDSQHIPQRTSAIKTYSFRISVSDPVSMERALELHGLPSSNISLLKDLIDNARLSQSFRPIFDSFPWLPWSINIDSICVLSLQAITLYMGDTLYFETFLFNPLWNYREVRMGFALVRLYADSSKYRLMKFAESSTQRDEYSREFVTFCQESLNLVRHGPAPHIVVLYGN